MAKLGPELLSLLADWLQLRNRLEWAHRIPPDEKMGHEEARKIVAEVLKKVLFDTPKKSADLGMKTLHGLLSLEKVFPGIKPSEAEIDLAIAKSKADYTTFQALRMLVVLGYPQQFAALRAWERALKADLLVEPPAPKGPSVYRDTHRNMALVSQLRQLEQLNFKPTRSEKKSKFFISGCDIVAGAMKDVGHAMSYSTVETIWKNRNTAPAPNILASMLKQAILADIQDKKEMSSGK